ncbi:hypothetical protein [Rubrivirga litoralis]|uniref:Uncharacterized protein n=1 Tax=Rubrivirga litoralis TaxID=3075598 RepID=A0ABU3BUD9_9BACT|nr:hypothetical protein [Rubrivirga sp. F394]MDT0632910.1 hypothetical protein [Rubrivirga sp. F394]
MPDSRPAPSGDGAAPPDPRGRIRKTVGRRPAQDPLAVVWRLRQDVRALGLATPNPDAHVRKRVGRPRPC